MSDSWRADLPLGQAALVLMLMIGSVLIAQEPTADSAQKVEAERLDTEVLQALARNDPKAEARAKKAIAAWELVPGKPQVEMAKSWSRLAQAFEFQEKYKEALSARERSLAVLKDATGEQSPEFAKGQYGMGLLYWNLGDTKEAERRLLQALAIFDKGDRRESRLQSVLNDLGVLYHDLGNLDAARLMSERALALAREFQGDRHGDTTNSLNSLGSILKEQGDYSAARPLLEAAVRIQREIAGPLDLNYGMYLNSLALLFDAEGDLTSALRLLEESAVVKKQVAGPRSLEYARAMNNIGAILGRQKRFEESKAKYELAAEIRKERLNDRHPEYAVALKGIAHALHDQDKDLDQALRLFDQALAIEADSLGKDHPSYARTLISLGGVLLSLERMDEARARFAEGLVLIKARLGIKHPAYAGALANMAGVLWVSGKPAEAVPYIQEALGCYEELIFRNVPFLPERERLAMLKSNRGALNAALTLWPKGPEADEALYRRILAWKGVATEASTRLSRPSPALLDKLAERNQARSELASLVTMKVPAAKAEVFRRKVDLIQANLDTIDAELARASSWDTNPPTPEQVIGAFAPDSALVDFIRFDAYKPGHCKGEGFPSEARYAAFIVRRGSKPVRVDLGLAGPIDSEIARWRAAIQAHETRSKVDATGRELAERLWTPIVDRLEGIKTVLIVPDGRLNFVPWSALPDPKTGTYLIERFAIATLVSGRQLLSTRPRTLTAANSLLVVGNVDYDHRGTGQIPTDKDRVAAVDPSQLPHFDKLPSTAAEAAAVARLFEPVPGATTRSITGPSADKATVREAMRGRRYLHLATHGYFADPALRSALRPDPGSGQELASGYYPGLLSGLVWAGGNLGGGGSGADFGSSVLTAEEIAGLDLVQCDLAVLSACETSLGEVAGGEGVLGLQRAFHVAGARTVISSLWRIDDDTTRALMTRFYENLWSKHLPPLESLRQAQLALLHGQLPIVVEAGADRGVDPTRRTRITEATNPLPRPHRWAAFVLSGDVR